MIVSLFLSPEMAFPASPGPYSGKRAGKTQVLKGRPKIRTPLQGLYYSGIFPRALPWAILTRPFGAGGKSRGNVVLDHVIRVKGTVEARIFEGK